MTPAAQTEPDKNKRPRWRPSTSLWIVGALTLMTSLVGAALHGVWGFIMMLGVAALLTGIYAAIAGRPSWAGLPSRAAAGVTAGVGLVAMFSGALLGNPVQDRADLADPSFATAPVPTSSPNQTNDPVRQPCDTLESSLEHDGKRLICEARSDGKLVWVPEAESETAAKAAKAKAEKAAADKAAALKAEERKVAAEQAAKKLAAQKAAEQKAAADQAEAARKAQERAAAQKLAEERQAAERRAPANPEVIRPVAPPAAPVAPRVAPVPPPAAPPAGVVHPGAFCNGGTGVTKAGTPMVCAPAKDGRYRWQRG